VADYWPEFAQAGKGSVTVRQLLSHQAGLPVLDQPLTLGDLVDPAKLSAKIAAQAPAWTPRGEARLSRRLARLVRIRTHPACRPHRAFPRPLFCRGDRHTARPRLLHRVACFGGP
jgi:Beta-lactamase